LAKKRALLKEDERFLQTTSSTPTPDVAPMPTVQMGDDGSETSV
jgi:hypothetical protein